MSKLVSLSPFSLLLYLLAEVFVNLSGEITLILHHKEDINISQDINKERNTMVCLRGHRISLLITLRTAGPRIINNQVAELYNTMAPLFFLERSLSLNLIVYFIMYNIFIFL